MEPAERQHSGTSDGARQDRHVTWLLQASVLVLLAAAAGFFGVALRLGAELRRCAAAAA